MEFGDARDFRCESHVTECMTRLAIKDKHKDMIITWNWNFQERRILAQLIVLITLMVEQNLIRLCIGFFYSLNLEKKEFAKLYYKGF
jgi:hypothetical protein